MEKPVDNVEKLWISTGNFPENPPETPGLAMHNRMYKHLPWGKTACYVAGLYRGNYGVFFRKKLEKTVTGEFLGGFFGEKEKIFVKTAQKEKAV